jgi:hypothetical protein
MPTHRDVGSELNAGSGVYIKDSWRRSEAGNAFTTYQAGERHGKDTISNKRQRKSTPACMNV